MHRHFWIYPVIAICLYAHLTHAEEFRTLPRNLSYAELSNEDRDLLDRGLITSSEYVTGGVIGSIVGLGIGHAVERRYGDSGWVFTVGEMASLAVAGAGSANCVVSTLTHTSCTSSAGVVTAGVIGFLGFRVWEIIDLWAVPPELNHRYHELKKRMGESEVNVTASPILIHDSAGLALTLSF